MKKRKNRRSVELFSWAGGLALGVSKTGFHHEVLVEWNRSACETLRKNSGCSLANDWAVYEGDIAKFDFSFIENNVDLLAGGPPCQPFSIGGKHRWMDDQRNLFPQYFRAVRSLRPKAFIVENVRGLTRKAFGTFFEYIKLSLSYPEVEVSEYEDWIDHHKRLQQHHTSGNKGEGLQYNVITRLVNVADYGVPQMRWRVFFVGFRSDIPANWNFPEPTHSEEALLHDKWITGDYWKRHNVPRHKISACPFTESQIQKRLDSSDLSCLPWATVRDAIGDLPHPTRSGSKEYKNHVLQLGARAYPGHTGSCLDEPAKALKAGVHWVPGGENMIAFPDWTVRYFTVREAARIQTFPDDYEITGSWSEAMKQLGNAVPVNMWEMLSSSILEHLETAEAICHKVSIFHRES